MTFVIGVPIGILTLYLISLSGLEKNPQQIKFEEERALLYDNQSSLTTARDVDCNFINKYGTTFVNWTGEIKSIDEEHIVILSDANGIEVQYKIFDWVLDLGGFHSHYDSITGNVNDRTLNNEALDVGDNVYFSFHPVQSESDEDECFDETSFTKKGGLKAPEYMADIFRISKNPWEITHEQISKIKNKYNEEINKKIRLKEKEEEQRIAEVERKLDQERIKKQQFEASYYIGPSEDKCSFINFVITSKGDYVAFTGNKNNNLKSCTAEGNYTYNQDAKTLNISGFYNPNCYGTIEERNGIWKVKNNSIQAPNGVWFRKTSWSK